LCCKVFPLPVLDKPLGQWCKHVTASGCSIHDHGQPEVCREYACYWLRHEDVPEEFRPDRVGIVVSEWRNIVVRDESLPVLIVYQAHPGACRRRKADAWIDCITTQGIVALIVDGEKLQIVFDRERYPFVSSRDIEVAYLYDLSQKAADLARLGAVSQGCRPLTKSEAESLVARRPEQGPPDPWD
jgi:hypothetical protein